MILQAQKDIDQTQLTRCQEQIHNLTINCHVLGANDPGKDIIIVIIEKTQLLPKVSISTISRGYRDGSLPQKDDGLKHNIHIIGS